MTYSPNTALPSLRLFLTGGHEERKHNTKKGPALGSLLVETAVLVGHCGSLFRRDYLRVGKHFENQSKEAKEASVIAPWDPSWPPLPASGFISHPLELIRAAYAFAARRPDVVKYLPCYCGCEKQGHQSLEFCFVRRRTATGIDQWDGMGFT